MKKRSCIVTGLLASFIILAAQPAASFAAFVSGSTGADGDLTPTANTVLQIPDSGVFNFGTVNIPSGVTVTFKKNSANTPVTILATGDVMINGTISVNGSAGNATTPGIGGPGGFDGGIGGYVNSAGYRGQGPGGGIATSGAGGGGGFGASGSGGSLSNIYWGNNGNTPGAGGGTYGNAISVPLIGGSGGGGGGGTTSGYGGAGGAGGGAILIASSGTLTVGSSGTVSANGGNGAAGASYGGGGGSGGSIRLVATTITGEGNITATGGGSNQSAYGTWSGGNGGTGRIRLEAWQITRTSNTNPVYTSFVYPVAIYPTSPPSLAITQINGINTPLPSYGAFRTPDVTLPYNTTGPVTVTVTAQNVPAGKTVTVKALPESGNNVVTATGTLDSTSSVQVQLTLSSGTAYVLSASVNY